MLDKILDCIGKIIGFIISMWIIAFICYFITFATHNMMGKAVWLTLAEEGLKMAITGGFEYCPSHFSVCVNLGALIWMKFWWMISAVLFIGCIINKFTDDD